MKWPLILLLFLANPFLGIGQNRKTTIHGNKIIRVGLAYNSFEPYGFEDFVEMTKTHWIIPSVSPVLAASLNRIKERNDKNALYWGVEMSLNNNRSEFSIHSPDTSTVPSYYSNVNTVYSNISIQSGIILGEIWRIGPVVGVGGRLFSFGRDDIYALREFGLVDDGETKFNKNFKRLDFNVGAQCTLQPLAKYFIQANLMGYFHKLYCQRYLRFIRQMCS